MFKIRTSVAVIILIVLGILASSQYVLPSMIFTLKCENPNDFPIDVYLIDTDKDKCTSTTIKAQSTWSQVLCRADSAESVQDRTYVFFSLSEKDKVKNLNVFTIEDMAGNTKQIILENQ